jgi:hypothetical protein
MSRLQQLAEQYERHAALANQARREILGILGGLGLPETLLAAPPGAPEVPPLAGRTPTGRRRRGQLAADVLECLKQGPQPYSGIVQRTGGKGGSLGTVLSRLTARGRLVKTADGLYALAAAVPATRRRGRPPGSIKDRVAYLVARYQTLTPMLVSRELGLTLKQAANALAAGARGTPKKPARLVAVRRGRYVAADGPLALAAALTHAVAADKGQAHPKSWVLRKRRQQPEPAPADQKNSEPATPPE